MLALAISFEQTKAAEVVETEDGTRITVRNWPQDSETNIVAYQPNGCVGRIVIPSELAEDIAHLLRFAKQSPAGFQRSAWYKRLEQYAEGAD
jgi:hypothetical protein